MMGFVFCFGFVWLVRVFFLLNFLQLLYVFDTLFPSQCDVSKYWVGSHIFVSWFICGGTMIPKEEACMHRACKRLRGIDRN